MIPLPHFLLHADHGAQAVTSQSSTCFSLSTLRGQSSELHVVDCSVGGQRALVSMGCRVIDRKRYDFPPPHPAEQDDQSFQEDMSQVLGSGQVWSLHCFVSKSWGHSTPPFVGDFTICLTRRVLPMPHSCEHASHVVHSPTSQLTGDGAVYGGGGGGPGGAF